MMIAALKLFIQEVLDSKVFPCMSSSIDARALEFPAKRSHIGHRLHLHCSEDIFSRQERLSDSDPLKKLLKGHTDLSQPFLSRSVAMLDLGELFLHLEECVAAAGAAIDFELIC